MPLVSNPPKRPGRPQAAPVELVVEPVAAPIEEAPALVGEVLKTGRYQARKFPIHHPYQNVLIPISGAVLLEVDNWVEVQVSAGVIVQV